MGAHPVASIASIALSHTRARGSRLAGMTLSLQYF